MNPTGPNGDNTNGLRGLLRRLRRGDRPAATLVRDPDAIDGRQLARALADHVSVDRSAGESESPAAGRARRLAADFSRRMQGRLASEDSAREVFAAMMHDGLLVVRDPGRDELGVWLPRQPALAAMRGESTLRLSWPGGSDLHADLTRPIVEVLPARAEDGGTDDV